MKVIMWHVLTAPALPHRMAYTAKLSGTLPNAYTAWNAWSVESM